MFHKALHDLKQHYKSCYLIYFQIQNAVQLTRHYNQVKLGCLDFQFCVLLDVPATFCSKVTAVNAWKKHFIDLSRTRSDTTTSD